MEIEQAIALYARNVASRGELLSALQRRHPGTVAVDTRDPSREGARHAFDTANPHGVDRAVVAVAPADRGSARPLLEWSTADWRRCSDETQWHCLQVLQGLYDALAGRPCTVVLLGASIGVTGAARHAALATATEGQRGLMKSLARQWAPQVRFAWLSVWTPLLFPDVDEADLPEQVELGDYMPPLGRPGWDEVAGGALALGARELAGLTGQTTIMDGGEWMLS